MQQFLKLFENLLFWLLIFLMVFIPLYPKFPIINIHGTFVAIRIEDFLIAITLGLWLIYLMVSQKWRVIAYSNMSKVLCLFFFVGAVSTFCGLFLTHTITLTLGSLNYLRRIELMMLLPFAFTVVKTKKQVMICLYALTFILIAANLYAFGQRYLDWPVISTDNSEFAKGQILRLTPGARVNSTFAGHYDFAVFLSMAITLLVTLFFVIKNRILQGGLIILTAVSFVMLVMTAARLSFVAMGFGVFISLILVSKKRLLVVLLLIFVLSLLYPSQLRDRLLSTISVNFQQQGLRYGGADTQQVQRSRLNIPTLSTTRATSAGSFKGATVASDIVPGEPIDTTQLGVYRSFEIRINVEWPAAIRSVLKNPLLGTGYSSLGLATDNDILRSLGEVGILGTLAFTLVMIYLIKTFWKQMKLAQKFNKFVLIGMFSMVLVFIVNGLFIDVFEASKVASLFWLVMGIGLALAKIDDPEFLA